MDSHTVIMGLDPGYRRTGYGVIDYDGERARCLDCGYIDLQNKDLALRLRVIFESVRVLIDKFAPQVFAVEEVFLARNPSIAFKLGHARAAAIVAAAVSDIRVVEYSARTIKLALTGVGAADKAQVAYMVAQLLNMPKPPEGDDTDALAAALCHAHHREIVPIEDANAVVTKKSVS